MKIACPLGDMFMTAVYAPTGRATCKGCQAKIGKDELRLSNIVDEDHYHQEHHYHADCFSLKSAFKNATYKDIFHVENLTKEDQEKVKAILEKLQKKEIKKKPQQKKVNAKSKQTKPKKSDVDDDDSDSDYDYKKDKNQKDNKQSKALKPKKVEANKKSEQSELSDSGSDDEEPDVFVLYDKTQKEEFRKIQQELEKKSAGQLKQMLKANDQKQTGNKGELIERIADCIIKGCLEKCPNCSGGRPKLNPVQKNFKCPGYMDDTEFRFCNKVYGPKDLKRIPWVDV